MQLELWIALWLEVAELTLDAVLIGQHCVAFGPGGCSFISMLPSSWRCL